MERYVRLRELLVGIEGLALLRNLYDGPDEAAARRLAEVTRILEDDSLSEGEWMAEADSRAGYAAWSDNYDDPGNPIIAIEQPAVWSLLDRLAPGEALDAGCGTGRHAQHLVQLGHVVTGIDVTPEMLARARQNVPDATFLEADVRSIPADEASFDSIVSGLALAHVPDLEAAMGELARVLRPGGRLTISILHPFQAHLGWHAPFKAQSGRRGFVREHAHTHADYFRAFGQAGLTVRACLEPALGVEAARAKRRASRHIPEAVLEAYLGLPGVLVWEAEKTGPVA